MITTRRLTDAEMAEFEKKAARGEPMPDDLNGPERALYISLRGLYYQYRQEIIDREQAKKEKTQVVNDYYQAVLGERCREKSVKIWHRLPTDAYKCECPECKRIVGIILGLE